MATKKTLVVDRPSVRLVDFGMERADFDRGEKSAGENSGGCTVQVTCGHCGTRFTDGDGSGGFCCAGCREAAMRIKRAGLGDFYRMKGKSIANPVKSIVFQKRDASWFTREVEAAEAAAASGSAPHLDIDVQGISCVGCVWLIDRIFKRQPGALRIDVNSQAGRAKLRWTPGAFDAAAFADELQRLGYPVGPWRAGTKKEVAGGLPFRLGVCGALAMNSMAFTLPTYLGMGEGFAFAWVFQVVVMLSATLSLAIGGSYFISHAWAAVRAGTMHIDLPISLGIVAAYLGSAAGWIWKIEGLLYFDFVAIFVFLMLLGRWVQQAAIAKNRNRLLSGEGIEREVMLVDGARVGVDSLVAGMEFEVPSGEMAPVAGILQGADAEVSLEWINGEPEARDMKTGRAVPAGAVNIGRGNLRLKASENYRDSLLSKLVAEGEERSSSDPRVERFLRIYLGVVVVLGVVGGIGWLMSGGGWAKALQVFISVLVVSCPCALGLALPLADEIVVAKLRRLGLFVRADDLWRRLALVRRIVFDKTGTLTLEVPELEGKGGEALDSMEISELRVLGTLVEESRHPVGRALREELAMRDRFDPIMDAVVSEEIGKGVSIVDADGREWRLGKAGWSGSGGACDCVLSVGGRIVAEFNFREALRPKAREEIGRLRDAGVDVYILSGDRKEKVQGVADALGLPGENCLGGLSPDEKAEWVRGVDGGRGTLFIGDGANDSLAFEEAAVRATPAVDLGVLERKSDFYFLGRGLEAIRAAFVAGALHRRAVRSVIAFAIAYNVIAVGLCFAGVMSPLLAAVLMPLSSITTMVIVASRLRSI